MKIQRQHVCSYCQMFSSEAGLTAGDQEEEHPKVIDTGLDSTIQFSSFKLVLSDEEEEHAEAEQEDGQDVQEDAGEAEAAEEEGEV